MRNARIAFVLVLAALVCAPAAAHADPYTLGPDGETADVHSYTGAIRERVYIPQPGVDTDGNGVTDDVAVEIIRPATIDRVAAIVDPSPYYSQLANICRGNESQCIGDTDSNGINDKWPLFLDNYFVPRGFALIYAEALGTANSTGCVMHGGPDDVNAMRSVIDWLNGRVPGFRGTNGTGGAVAATWHNGSSAMIGKSYDGTLTNAVAATGVAGLKAIVPESAIDDWYRYSRMGGLRLNQGTTHYPRSLSSAVTDPLHRSACSGPWATLDAADGDATGDRSAFWDARDYLPDVANVRAAVLAVHGLQDDNVRMDHLATWWSGLEDVGVPRKLWLLRAGHADPFDVRRAVWVDTLHKWFDHWLYGIPNDVMDQPRVDIENADETWSTQADWPAADVATVDLHLRSGAAATDAGTLALTAGGALSTVSWLNAPSQSESTILASPGGSQASRRVFLSAPLKQDLRISGTPVVRLKAALDQTQSNLGALVVDYGAGQQVTRTGEGLLTDRVSAPDCVGEEPAVGSGDFSACYKRVTQPFTTLPAGAPWLVTKGVLDSANAASLYTPALASVGVMTDFPIRLIPQDEVIPAGHQLAVILVGDYSTLATRGTGAAANITVDLSSTTLSLPVSGGATAVARSGAFDTTAPVLTLPADQAVSAPAGATGTAATWAAPGVTDDQDPSPTVACDPASGSTFAVGTTVVTCTATDASGNAARGTFTVTVGAAAPPASSDGGRSVGGTTPPAVTPPASRPLPQAPIACAALDCAPFTLAGLKLKGGHRRATAAFTLSGKATITVRIKRHGAKKTYKTLRKVYAKGRVALVLKALRAGRYDITITAKPAVGGAAPRALRGTVRVA